MMDLDGHGLRDMFDLDPGWFIENLEDQFSEQGMQGIHVWEGEPNLARGEDEEGDTLTCDLRKGTWRPPTDAEWVALRACRSPFNSDRLMLGSLVE